MFPQLENNTHDLIYKRRLHSGLGDRFGVLFGLITIATIHNKKLYYVWSNGRRHDRIYDLKMINKYVKLPNTVLQDKDDHNPKNYFMELIHRKGGKIKCSSAYDCIPDLIPHTFDNVSIADNKIDSFKDAYYKTLENVDVTIGTLPNEKYIVFHLRGTDKRYKNQHKDVVNTVKIINDISNTLNLRVIVLTDDHELKRLFKINHELQYENPFTSKTEKDLYDFRLMMHSVCMIQYSPLAWSAYSNVASLTRKVPLINTCSDTFSRLKDFKEMGSNITFWFGNDEIDSFISYMKDTR